EDYEAWSDRLLEDQRAFVVPSSHGGRPNARFAIVNPLTTFDDLVDILDSMECARVRGSVVLRGAECDGEGRQQRLSDGADAHGVDDGADADDSAEQPADDDDADLDE